MLLREEVKAFLLVTLAHGLSHWRLWKSCAWYSPSAAFLVCGSDRLLRSGKVIQEGLPFRIAPSQLMLRSSLVTRNMEHPPFDCLACSLGKYMHGFWCRACPGETAWCLKIHVVGMMVMECRWDDAEFQGVGFSLSDLEISS